MWNSTGHPDKLDMFPTSVWIKRSTNCWKWTKQVRVTAVNISLLKNAAGTSEENRPVCFLKASNAAVSWGTPAPNTRASIGAARTSFLLTSVRSEAECIWWWTSPRSPPPETSWLSSGSCRSSLAAREVRAPPGCTAATDLQRKQLKWARQGHLLNLWPSVSMNVFSTDIWMRSACITLYITSPWYLNNRNKYFLTSTAFLSASCCSFKGFLLTVIWGAELLQGPLVAVSQFVHLWSLLQGQTSLSELRTVSVLSGITNNITVHRLSLKS